MKFEWLPFLLGLAAMYAAFWVFRRLRQVSSAVAHEWVERGALLLDVRTKSEFESGHLPGAVNIPLPAVTANVAAVGDVKRPVVVYCASGTRSALASTVLRRAGFSQVADLGAMSRW